MLSGTAPFDDASQPRLFENIRAGLFSFDDPCWDKISDTAKSLIRRMLCVDVTRRITLEQIEQSEWLDKSKRGAAAATTKAKSSKTPSKRRK